MKRFRFRLARVERWRRQIERERRHEHAAATASLHRAEEALDAHERERELLLEHEAQRRGAGGGTIEEWLADERAREVLALRRESLSAEVTRAVGVAEATLQSLVDGKRDLEVVLALERVRRARWQREIDVEAQKQADEAHRARIGKDLFREEGETR